MKLNNRLLAFAAFGAVCIAASCNKMDSKLLPPSTDAATTSLAQMTSENGNNPDELALQTAASGSSDSYLYTESNKVAGNSIIEFTQKKDGSLINRNEFASGGRGTGAGLGSQGAVCISRDMNLLFAVNAGSGTISSFRIKQNGALQLLFTLGSNGLLPNSVTIHGNILYVLNTQSALICGFLVEQNGFFSKINGSMHSLSSLTADAPQISFQPDGKALLVTEKMTNTIDRFEVNESGAITSASFLTSSGITPFGFDFSLRAKAMIVSNANNGYSGAGSCTSYISNGQGGFKAVNQAGNFQTSPCWAAATQYGAFAFISNTGSNAISSYYVDTSGALTLLKSVAAKSGSKPVDIVVNHDNKYVYNLNSGSHSISEYKRMPGGALSEIGTATTLPEYAAGLVSY